jgi:hypothetical protein
MSDTPGDFLESSWSSKRGLTEDVDFEAAVRALYSACHLPEPVVVAVDSAPAYKQALHVFEPSGTLVYFALAMFTALVTVGFYFLGAVLWWVLSFIAPWPPGLLRFLPLAAGLASGLSLLVANEHDERSKPAKRTELSYGILLDATLSLPDSIRKRGAGITPEALVGCLASAVAAAGGGWPHRDGEDERKEWGNASLRLGTVPVAPRSTRRDLRLVSSFVTSWRGKSQTERAILPLVLQRACDVAGAVDEATFLDGVAIVLVRGSHSEWPRLSVESSRYPVLALSTLEGHLQKRCQAILNRKNQEVGALLRETLEWKDLQEREAVYQVVGLDRVVNLLAVAPSATDGSGRLYRIGKVSSVLCFVRVEDSVMDEDGHTLVHWIAVPQHIVTAHEGIAWSFTLSDADYHPTVES